MLKIRYKLGVKTVFYVLSEGVRKISKTETF